MDTEAPYTPRQMAGLAERMLDAGRGPEFIVAYLAQRGTDPRAARRAVHAVVDRRSAARRAGTLRRQGLAVESAGAALVLAGAGVAWGTHQSGTAGTGPALLLAALGYGMAWRGLVRGLDAERIARHEVRRRRALGRVPA